MKVQRIQQLLSLNAEFYQTFGKAFASTRRRIQSGVRHLAETIPTDAKILDIGCGSGTLASVLLEELGFKGYYIGIDFSHELLDEARKSLQSIPGSEQHAAYQYLPLQQDNWQENFTNPFDYIFSFAVLHHIPGKTLRNQILQNVFRLLKPGGYFFHSEWQLQNSERLMKRILPWETLNIPSSEMEKGDVLMDWRHSLPDQEEETGLRYVHLYSQQELQELAVENGFSIQKEFYSDGKEGNLGLYQIWQKST